MMLPIRGTYHPPEDSILHEFFGELVPGTIIKIEPFRIAIRIEFEERLDHEEPHTVIIYAPHERVTVG